MPNGTDKGFGPRVAVLEAKVQALQDEYVRTRERLHKIEGGEAAVKLLAQQVGTVTEIVKELADSLETTAARAAHAAVQQWMEVREEKTRMSWSQRLQFVAVAIAAGGFVWAILLRFAS